MATEQLALSITEKGALQVKRNIAEVGTAAAASDASVKLLQTALGGMAVLGISAGIGNAVQTLAHFSQEMSTVAAVIGEINPDKLQELEDRAISLGTSTRYTATEAAAAMGELARAGLGANDVLAAVGPTLTMAQADSLGLAQAAEIAVNVLAGFNMTAKETQRVVDVMAMAANSSTSGIQDIGEAMSYVAPVAAGLGVSMEETAAAVELLSNAGMKGSRAGTNLTMIMRMLANPTTEQQKALQKLGLTVEDVSIKQHGFTGALENFRKAGAGSVEIFDFFNRSAAAASVVLRGSSGEMQKFTAQNEKAAGTAQNMATIMDDNLNGALLKVKASWQSVILAFGKQGSESQLTTGLLKLAEALRYVGTHIDSAGKNVVALGAIFAAVKFAPFLQGLNQAVASTMELQAATLSGNAVILGSAQAQAMKTAAVTAAAQAETGAAVAVAQAEAAKTAAILEVIPAQNAETAALAEAAGAEAAYTALMERRAALELQHAGQLQALAAAEAQHAVATEAGAAAQVASATATAAATSKMALLNRGLLAVKASASALWATLAANPLTVIMVAGAAAVMALNAAFDKQKDKIDRLAAAEEKAHQEKLKGLQTQVREIQARKASDAAIAQYIAEMEFENRLLALNDSARENLIDITKAEEAAKRELTATERAQIEQLNRTNQLLKAEKGMLDSIMGPLYEYQDAIATLDRLKAKGKVTDIQYAQERAKLQEQYGQTDKMDEYMAKLNAETEALKLNTAERKIKQDLLSAESDVGRPLGPTESAQVEAKLREKQALEDMNAAYERIMGPQIAYARQEKELKSLLDAKLISQEKYNYLMKELALSLSGYDQLLANAQREGELLKMTNEERAKRQFILEAERQAQTDLTTAQESALWAQEQLNQKQYEYNQLVASAKSPATGLREEMSMLNRALDDGKITQTEWATRTKDIKSQLEALEPTTLHMSQVLGSMWDAASSSIDTFVDTGIFKFKDFARSVISDITKMAAKMALLQAFKGIGGAFGSLFDIGGFATGGSFTVGGTGGTDSQLVAFKATPGEQVDVATPAQQAAREQGMQAQAGVTVVIMNVVDPSEIPTAMASSAGRDVIMNTISLNKSSVRQAIS